MPSLVVFIIAVALLFDFVNGFHDAANSIATVVSTRVLTPLQAVVWAAVFNFVAAFGFGVKVATTVGRGVVQPDVVDPRVILAAHAAIGLGTLAGGWRIVRTMGMRITKLRPVGGFSAETAGAVTLIGTAIGGIPVSTTHTISGSIMGVGAISRFSAVRWGVAGRIVSAWIFTIPAAALVSAVAWLLLRPLPL